MVSSAVLDPATFEAATDRALRGVERLREPVSPALAAQLHRVVGIRRLVAGDALGARDALEASARIEPSHRLSTTAAPEGGPLDQAWSAALLAGASLRRPFGLPVVARVDGTAADGRPQVGPYVLQERDETDAIAWSCWVSEGWPTVPLEPTRTPPAPAPAPAPAVAAAPAPRGGEGFLVGSLAVGGRAAGRYGASVGGRLRGPAHGPLPAVARAAARACVVRGRRWPPTSRPRSASATPVTSSCRRSARPGRRA